VADGNGRRMQIHLSTALIMLCVGGAVSGLCVRLFQYAGVKGDIGSLIVLVGAWEIYILYLTAVFCEWWINRKSPPEH